MKPYRANLVRFSVISEVNRLVRTNTLTIDENAVSMPAFTMFGRIPLPDRFQRILFGACLMALTVFGLLESTDWKKRTALVMQMELLSTGLAGWYPVYGACRVGPPAKNNERNDSPRIQK